MIIKNKSKILVIEDTHSLREVIVDILTFEGMQVIEAENGQVGIDKAKEHLPDLILCDIMMPVKDGYQVFHELSHNIDFKHTPFIFLSAKTTAENVREGMILGADDYITKPFQSDLLISSIKSRLKKEVDRKEALKESFKMGENNISKIKYLVEKLTIRDQELRNKVQRISILESAFHRTGQPIAILTTHNKYIFVNKSFAKHHGYDNPDEMIGKDKDELFGVSVGDNPLKEINESLEKTGSWFGEYLCPHKTGKSFLSELYLDILEDEGIIICTCNKIDCNVKNEKVKILKS